MKTVNLEKGKFCSWRLCNLCYHHKSFGGVTHMNKKTLPLILLFVTLNFPSLYGARTGDDDSLYENIDIFAKALHYVRKNYIEVPNDEELLFGAIEGMLQKLDPHSSFMAPDLFKELELDTKGRFGGVGIEVSLRDDLLTVIAPIEGAPAERAGIKAGDKILRINGKSTKGMSLGEAVKLMRGKPGEKIELTLGRKGQKLFDVTITRDIIRIRSVRYDDVIKGGVAYIRVSAFQQDTTKSLKKALTKLIDQDKDPLKGLILDLRNNPGGLLNEAISVSDMFLSAGVIVSTKSRGEPERKSFARAAGTYSDFPIIVLVNGGSASASEIVAGALQDHGRAVVLGTDTFGKGSVQTVYELGNGSAIKLTIARYYTPNGRSIQADGIHPDIYIGAETVQKTEDAAKRTTIREKDLDQHLEREEDVDLNKNGVEFPQDPQKQAAIDYLRSWNIFGKKSLVVN
jgi:carboxyl-terminal processing protease